MRNAASEKRESLEELSDKEEPQISSANNKEEPQISSANTKENSPPKEMKIEEPDLKSPSPEKTSIEMMQNNHLKKYEEDLDAFKEDLIELPKVANEKKDIESNRLEYLCEWLLLLCYKKNYLLAENIGKHFSKEFITKIMVENTYNLNAIVPEFPIYKNTL